jgi:hypothetical protein
MTQLGAVIAQAIVHRYGRDEFLRRLANPFWFQSFGTVMGTCSVPTANLRRDGRESSGHRVRVLRA